MSSARISRRRAARICAGLTLLVGGCSSPEWRIRQHRALFESLPAEAQERIRGGNIALGDTKDMVFLALGRPDREYVRTSAEGTTEVWSYTDVATSRERRRVTGDFRVRDPSGRLRTVHDTVWVDVDREHEYERLRIEFQNGVVKAIEHVAQPGRP